MWNFNARLAAFVLGTLTAVWPAPLAPTQQQGAVAQESSKKKERERDLKRPREEVFVKAYPISDITGRQKAARLGQVALNSASKDAERVEALRDLQALEASGAVTASANEVADLMRSMMTPSFDSQVQSLTVGNGTDLIVSGNRMQHNSVRLLLHELRSDDRFVKLVVSVYELPPVALPPSWQAGGSISERDLPNRYFNWLTRRVRESDKPTYERTVKGEVGRPIRLDLTRKLPLVSDYQRRRLVDSKETVLEPIVEEVVEGLEIEVLIGRFQGGQLVVRTSVEHRSCLRPIPTRTLRMENGEEVVVQVPEIIEVSGMGGMHTGFGHPISMATTMPIPTAPRKDYVVVVTVER